MDTVENKELCADNERDKSTSIRVRFGTLNDLHALTNVYAGRMGRRLLTNDERLLYLMALVEINQNGIETQ